MKYLSHKLPQKSVKKDYILNMLGSIINSCVSVILLVLVSRLTPPNSTLPGALSLAYTTAQMMYTIGVFEMRNIQATDAKNEFGFANILMFRIITIFGMFVFAVFFVLFKGFTGTKAVLILLLTAYMAFQSLSDVFQGVLQKNGYLFLSGMSVGGIGLFALLSFSVTFFLTRNLIISVIPMTVFAAVWIFFFDIPFAVNLIKIKFEFNLNKLVTIFMAALPLFLASFLQQYIFNSQKYAIEDCIADVNTRDIVQATYGYLVMPTFFINLLSIFVFRPQLVTLSENWIKGQYKKFIKIVSLLYGCIAIAMILALGCAYILGIPVLEFLYNADLSNKRGCLLILLVAGTFSAACSLTSVMLTVIRKQKFGLISYIVAFLLSFFLPKILFQKYGLFGACVSYTIEMFVLFTVLFAIFIYFIFSKTKSRCHK